MMSYCVPNHTEIFLPQFGIDVLQVPFERLAAQSLLHLHTTLDADGEREREREMVTHQENLRLKHLWFSKCFSTLIEIQPVSLCQTVRGVWIKQGHLRLCPLRKNKGLGWHLRKLPRAFPEGHIMSFF